MWLRQLFLVQHVGLVKDDCSIQGTEMTVHLRSLTGKSSSDHCVGLQPPLIHFRRSVTPGRPQVIANPAAHPPSQMVKENHV